LEIKAGPQHSLILMDDNNLYSCGFAKFGALGYYLDNDDPSENTIFTKIDFEKNFEIKNNSKIDPNIYNFAKKYCNRENQILFTKNLRQSKVLENYNILEENNEKENIYLKNEDELIEELRDKYQLNKEDISKSGYKNIINEIINKNENVQDANYKAYYNNILSILEINKDLNSSIIK
jgi:alpha-tubulin suppressor-like RCC1 family protein